MVEVIDFMKSVNQSVVAAFQYAGKIQYLILCCSCEAVSAKCDHVIFQETSKKFFVASERVLRFNSSGNVD